MKVEKNLLIRMKDGVNLAADVYRPDDDGKRSPAILAYTPYRKDDMALSLDSYLGLHDYFVERGYAFVYVDVRGTGGSEGSTSEYFSRQEQEDGYNVVEWIAAQPWCDGNVGMTGKSYDSFITLLVAARNPPHLKAIIPMFGCGDKYQVYFPGGNIRYLMMALASAFRIGIDFAPPAYRDPDGRWLKVWREHLENNQPMFLKEMEQQTVNSTYRDESTLEVASKIRIPTFLVSGWYDTAPTFSLKMFNLLPGDVPKKVLIGPWTHSRPDLGTPRPRIDFLPECERWFDRWLKGTETGVDKEPQATIFIRGYAKPAAYRSVEPGEWHYESSWPPKRCAEEGFYLRSGAVLGREPDVSDKKKEEGAGDSYRYDPTVGTTSALWNGMGWDTFMATDQRPDEALSLNYTTAPLTKELEISGDPYAVLYVSSSASVASFAVKLSVVSPDGVSAQITRGILNATRRSSWEDPSPLRPGEVYEIKVNMESLSYVVPAGHAIRLSISSANFPEMWPTPQAAVNSVFHDGAHPSRIMLPIASVARSSSSDSVPVFGQPKPLKTEIVGEGEVLRWEVANDVLSSRKSVHLETISKFKIDDLRRSTFSGGQSVSVNRDKPEDSSASGFFRGTFSMPIGTEIKANSTIRGDSQTFEVSASVEILVEGRPYFSKSWIRSVPRELL